jgi:hypothetical protein
MVLELMVEEACNLTDDHELGALVEKAQLAMKSVDVKTLRKVPTCATGYTAASSRSKP